MDLRLRVNCVKPPAIESLNVLFLLHQLSSRFCIQSVVRTLFKIRGLTKLKDLISSLT